MEHLDAASVASFGRIQRSDLSNRASPRRPGRINQKGFEFVLDDVV